MNDSFTAILIFFILARCAILAIFLSFVKCSTLVKCSQENSACRGPTFIFGTFLWFVLLNELMLFAILAGARFSIADEILVIFAISFGSILSLTFSIQ